MTERLIHAEFESARRQAQRAGRIDLAIVAVIVAASIAVAFGFFRYL